MHPPKVTVIGSCRVWTPFKLLHDAGRVQLANDGVYGFIHYAKEALQQLRVMHGQVRIPRALAPYITHKVLPPGDGEFVPTVLNPLRGTDLLVVEISSLKEIVFQDYYLQINRMREQLVGDDPELQRWWKQLYDSESKEDRRQYLASVARSTERNMVMFTETRVQTAESLARDMEMVQSFFDGPVLFVSHFNTPTFGGQRLAIRDRLAREVELNADSLAADFFNPKDLIEAFGMRAALQDLAHYTPQFERAIAECFAARFIEKDTGA